MHLEVSQVKNGGFVEVATHHKGKSLLWPTKAYSKIKLQQPERVFDEINGFLKTLPAEAQNQIWDSYCQIKEILDIVADNIHIGNTIRHYVSQMYAVTPMNEFHKWLLTQGNLFIPTDVQETMADNSRYKGTDKTYLKSSYVNLATLGLAMRLMVPIWGEFIDQATEGDYKEVEAVGLIDNTELKSWPEDEPTWDKLHNYIRYFSNDPSALIGNLWKGLGSEEIPDVLQAKAVVRRLTIVPLSDHNSHSIIANIFRYVKTNTKPQDRTNQDRVNRKRPDEGGGGEDDDKISIAESYKLKQRVSDGDAVLFNVSTRNMIGLCQIVDPTVDLNKVMACTYREQLNKVALIGEFQPHQIRLAQWVMAKAFPPRAFHLIDALSVIRLLGCTQALLWHWGYLDLAVLMQVELLNQSDQLNLTAAKQAKSGARISSKYKEALNLLYPYVKPQRIKASSQEGDENFVNTAAIAINNVTSDIKSSNWLYHGPDGLYNEAGLPEGRNVVVIPQTIKNTITEMVMHLAKLNQ